MSFLLAGNMVPVSLLFSLSGRSSTNTWPFLMGACVLQEDCVLLGGGEKERESVSKVE